MSTLAKVKDLFVKRPVACTKFALSAFSAFTATQVISMATLPAFASESDSSDAFSTHVDTSGKSVDIFASLFNRFVAPLQNLGAVLLVLAAVVSGIKIGVSAMTDDPRSRTSSIFGLFWIIVGAAVIIHARSLVGMVVGLK